MTVWDIWCYRIAGAQPVEKINTAAAVEGKMQKCRTAMVKEVMQKSFAERSQFRSSQNRYIERRDCWLAVVVQNKYRTASKEQALQKSCHALIFLCDHWSSSVAHISATFSRFFRSPEAKIPGAAAGTTALWCIATDCRSPAFLACLLTAASCNSCTSFRVSSFTELQNPL